MLAQIGLVLMLLVISPKVRALTEARLLNMSTSGQTVLLNLGTLDGIKEGDYGVIAKQIRDIHTRDLRVVPAAKARNVKAYGESSVWLIYHVYDHELLVKNDKYVVLSENILLNGRRKLTVTTKTIVTDKGKTTTQTLHALGADKERLSKLKDQYVEVQKNKTQVIEENHDATLFDVESWESNKNLKYRSALYTSPHKDEFNREMRLKTFEKLVTGYLKRVNDPDFHYDQFYDAQMRQNWGSSYAQYLRESAARNDEDAKLFRTVLEKGDRWSEDYSDEELTQTLATVSVMQEKDRKKYYSSKPLRWATSLDYGMNLSNAQSSKDKYNRSRMFSLEGEIETIPFLKHKQLERFSLTGSVRINQTGFESGDFNADLNEHSLSFGANWYPLAASYAKQAPVVFVGSYMRAGFANAQAPTPGEKANYSLMSLPGFRVGMKYILGNNFGLKAAMSFETLKLERYQSNKKQGNLPERQNLAEGKLGIGLTYIF